MGDIVIKPVPDEDYYCVWSSIVESPIAVGTHDEMLGWLYDRDDRKPDRIPPDERPEARLRRADETGTSTMWKVAGHAVEGAWDDAALIYAQRGILPRRNLRELCRRLEEAWSTPASDSDVAVNDLLEPFDDDHPVDDYPWI